ncbi:MAG: helix-turn-helix domain-containing protein [Candidatus Brocadiales bacterium]|nr:helix-turn-helix domain-containing protein [Candidatus Brocadiales bacterium]
MEEKILCVLSEINSNLQNKLTKKWLNIREASQYASVSESTIRRAIEKGQLKVSKTTGKLLFKVEWIERWLNG